MSKEREDFLIKKIEDIKKRIIEIESLKSYENNTGLERAHYIRLIKSNKIMIQRLKNEINEYK